MQRRDFVSSIGIGAGVVVVPPNMRITLHRGRVTVPLPIWAWLAKFAAGVGVSVTTHLINRYVTSRFFSPEAKQRIATVNTMMAAPGQDFSDLTKSDVYEGADGSFFYAAVRERPNDPEDKFNACAPFMDPAYVRPAETITAPAPAVPAPDPDPLDEVLSRGTITLMEGPSLVAVGAAAEALAGSTSTEYAQAILQPRTGVQRSQGTFQGGYVVRDEYLSDQARISIDYESDGSGAGMVEIIARHPVSGSRMFGETMDITYPTA